MVACVRSVAVAGWCGACGALGVVSGVRGGEAGVTALEPAGVDLRPTNYRPPITAMPALPALTSEQRAAFLALLAAQPALGNIAALRQVGIVRPDSPDPPSRGQLRKLLDDDLEADAREARGWSLAKAEDVLYKVAIDSKHKDWARAIAIFLKASSGRYHESVQVQHAGQVEVDNHDVADAIERFTSAVVRLAERGRAELASGEPD